MKQADGRSGRHERGATRCVQIQTLLAGPPDQPIVMVNLLRYKPRADGGDSERSGADAYARYARGMREVVESQGGGFVWSGRVDSLVIGETQEE